MSNNEKVVSIVVTITILLGILGIMGAIVTHSYIENGSQNKRAQLCLEHKLLWNSEDGNCVEP